MGDLQLLASEKIRASGQAYSFEGRWRWWTCPSRSLWMPAGFRGTSSGSSRGVLLRPLTGSKEQYMKGVTLMLVIAVGGLTSSGCSTMFDRGGGTPIAASHKGVYPGVRAWPSYAGEFLTRPTGAVVLTHFGPFALPFVLADLGLSAGIDTVMLPADAVYPLTRGHDNLADATQTTERGDPPLGQRRQPNRGRATGPPPEIWRRT
jgi:uncharacterized protein YceK